MRMEALAQVGQRDRLVLGVVDAVDNNNFWRVENGTAYDYNKYSDFNLDATLDAVDKNSYWRSGNGKSTQLP
jgi:hypothetical protein